jgi:putative membrane protein
MMMWYGGNGWGWAGWVVMVVVMVVFWAAVITAVVLAVRYLVSERGTRAGGAGSMLAEDVLAERFARGEVDEDEFRRRLTLLREQRTRTGHA